MDDSTSERNEKLTNKSSLVTLGVLFLIWLILAVYAFSAGDGSKIFPTSHGTSGFSDASRIFTIVEHVLLSGAYSILVFVGMRYFPNFSHLTLLVFWVPLPVSLALAFVKTNIFTVYGSIVALCSCVLTCNLIGTEWLGLPEKILKEACKAIVTSPATVIFSILYYLFTSFFVIFAVVLHFYLNTLTEDDGSYSIYTIALMIVNGVIWLWTFRFIFNVGCMVLSGCYAIWYWGEGKRINSETVKYCFKLILGYHLGTIALSTSLIGGGKVHRALVKYVIKRCREKSLNKSLICFLICNLFDKVVSRTISFFALATCMIKGQEFNDSIKESFQLYLINPRKSLVTIKVIECLLITTPFIISLLMLVSLHYYVDFSPSNEIEGKLNLFMIGVIALGSLIFVLPMLAMLYAACNTILLCYVEDSNLNDGTAEKPYAMSEELKKTLDYSDPPAFLCNKIFFCTKISSKVNVYRIS